MNEIKRTKFNIMLLGESRVGKTSMISYLTCGEYVEVGLLTAGIDCHVVETELGGKKYKFKIFDTAGQERYKSISKSSIKLADGFLIVFAIDNQESFNKVNDWIGNIQEEVNISNKVIFLVGNKCDIKERIISNEKVLDFANNKKLKYYETSAKTGFGINQVFNDLYQEIYNMNKKSTEKNISLNKNEKKKKDSFC